MIVGVMVQGVIALMRERVIGCELGIAGIAQLRVMRLEC